MRNILRLSVANIRKNKSQAISLLIFVLIAALLLSTGLTLLFGIGSFFDERAEASNAAHFTAIYEAGATNTINEGKRFMENHPDVTKIETHEIVGGWGNYFLYEYEYSILALLSRIDAQYTMDPPILIGESLPLTGDAIYVPYFMLLAGDLELGDAFRLEISGKDFYFTIAGATEEIVFGAQMNTVHRFYIPDARYDEISNELPNGNITLLSAQVQNVENVVFLNADYSKDVSMEGIFFMLSMDIIKQTRLLIPMIVAIVATVFAVILLAVSMIVIRFRIINSIEEGMTNIGTQKAIGYRSVQIIASITLQFGLTALLGGILGVTSSLFLTPLVISIIKPILALDWTPGFDITTAALSIAAVLLTVTLISYLTSRRISRLHPLIALRGGLTTHSFKKNSLPLDKTRGPLGTLLALKNLMQNKKQAAAICIIIALVSFASITGVAANHSMNDGSDEFARSTFGEIPDVGFVIAPGEETDAFKERMMDHEDVRKVFGYSIIGAQVLIDDTQVMVAVVEDPLLMEGRKLIRGRYPIHENEIALGTNTYIITGKSIGDTVTVKMYENEKDFIVTGFVQFMNHGGFNGVMTESAIRQLQPDYVLEEFNVYLNEGTDIEAFIETVWEAEGDVVVNVVNFHNMIEANLAVMGGIFGAVAVGIIAVTAFVIVLTLYMVIKATILRRRRELGIQKAVGFTTLQLMNQIALNLTPVIVIGVVIGAFGGYFGFNPMMVAFTSGMGVAQLNLPVMLDQVITVCIALVALAYIVSMLIAYRIRKISAYSLVTE